MTPGFIEKLIENITCVWHLYFPNAKVSLPNQFPEQDIYK